MDEPLRLVTEASHVFARVYDYSCVFVKRERLRDQLQPDQVMDMKVRNQPLSVYLRWLGPKAFAGQEVCYVAGRNNGMMRVHANGIKSVAGFINIDPNDPRVAQNSRHAITEAGLGNLINRLAGQWQIERQLNKTQVRIGEYTYNKLPCTRVEAIHPDDHSGRYGSFRTVVYFDKASHLPTRIEKYDWPRPSGSAEGDLLECYSYVNVRTNVGLRDGEFDH
jgi:hypothetical protein